ncbi:MAG: hypothetical protein IIC07_06680 [Proteobacteria bacterium]|nr:hypothetical protein [Pseudomonadota bacterium]
MPRNWCSRRIRRRCPLCGRTDKIR